MALSRKDMTAGIVALLLSLLVQNVGAAFAKLLFPLVGPLGVTALRTAISALLLLAWLRPWRRRVPRPLIPMLLGYGCMLGLMNLLIYQAFARIPIGIATGIEIIGPLAVALHGSRRTIDRLWLLAAAIGLLLLLPLRGEGHLDIAGLLFAAGAATCWAFYILFGTRISSAMRGDAVAWGMAIASLFTIPAGLATSGASILVPSTLAIGVVVACLSSALPYSLEMKAMEHLPAHVMGLLLSLYPVTAALAGLVILGEQLSLLQWCAILCIVLASGGFAWTASAPRPGREMP